MKFRQSFGNIDAAQRGERNRREQLIARSACPLAEWSCLKSGCTSTGRVAWKFGSKENRIASFYILAEKGMRFPVKKSAPPPTSVSGHPLAARLELFASVIGNRQRNDDC